MGTVGLDLFAGNGVIDLAKAKAEDGVQFAIFKATEGATFDDKLFTNNWDHAVNVNVQPGAYHFARPDNNSATTEAEHFLTVLGNRRGVIALDGETCPKGWPLFELAAWYGTWLQLVADGTGLRPFLYTYHRWVTTNEFAALRKAWPLWIPLDPETPHEITQRVRVVGTIGTLDIDIYGGTLDELRADAGLTKPAKSPAADPQNPHLPGDSMRVIRNTDNGRCYLAGVGTVFWLETVPQLDTWLGLCGQTEPKPVTTVDLADFAHTNPKEAAA